MFRSRTSALLFAAFVNLAAWQAEAQLTQTGAGKKPGGGPPAYVGPGDLKGSALQFVGVIAYNATWADGAHSNFRLIRADARNCKSTLGTSGVITVTNSCSTGGDNGTSVSSWCAASAPCIIDLGYDQSGAGLDWTQSAGATLAFGGACPTPLTVCIIFAGAQSYFNGIGSTALPMTVATVAIRTSAFSAEGDILVAASGGLYFDNGANSICIFIAGADCAPQTDSVWHTMQFAIQSGSSIFTVDNTPFTRSGFSFGFPANPFVGDKAAIPINPLNGALAYLGEWGSAFSTGDATAFCNRDNAQFSLGLSC
jgi:hypothetical protein